MQVVTKIATRIPPGLPGGRRGRQKPEPGTRRPFIEPDAATLASLGAAHYRKKQNRGQIREILRGAKLTGGDLGLIKAAAALKYCNATYLMRQTPTGQLQKVSTYNCGRKFCAVCASKKRKKLLFRYLEFFESENGEILRDSYDLALFTVTLRHNKTGLRSEPYYKELSTHWRNGLKYGAFKKYFAGGFYNTEHTYTGNGHHIHRHALILIPKEYELENNIETITAELRNQWASRTGGSFQIDLTPFYKTKSLKENLLEVTKYITKRGRGGVIPWEIVQAVNQNNRGKFYGKFGILHRIKELNINYLFAQTPEIETQPQERPLELDRLYICSKPVFETIPGEAGKKPIKVNFTFKEKHETPYHDKILHEFAVHTSVNIFTHVLREYDRYKKGYFYDAWQDWRKFQNRINPDKPPPDIQTTFEAFN